MLYRTPGLHDASSVFDAILTGFTKGAGKAIQGASVSAPSIEVPDALKTAGNEISALEPAWLKAIKVRIPNAGALVTSVKQELSNRPQPTSSSAAAPSRLPAKQISSSGLSVPMVVGVAGLGAAVYFLVRRRR